MRIIIIGGGLAGLSVYLHLRKLLPQPESHTITILERHDPAKSTAMPHFNQGGLAIAPNGMRVLRRLDEGLHTEIRKTGFLTKACSFRTAGGWSLATWDAWTDGPTREGMVMIRRDTLWNILRRRVPERDIRHGVVVEDVRDDGEIVLAGGETLAADLVIGADGVWSKTRSAVLDKDEAGREPVRQNPMTVGGTIPARYLEKSRRKSDEPKVVMTFGASGFIGYGPASTAAQSDTGDQESEGLQPGPRAMWWATYNDVKLANYPFHTSAPAEVLTEETTRASFAQRHGDWGDPTIRQLVADLSASSSVGSVDLKTSHNNHDSVSKATIKPPRPTYVTPSLPRWHRGHVVLLGDAAHALPVTSGQGVSMVLEDTAALSLLLAQALQEKTSAKASNWGPGEHNLVATLDRFQGLRRPRVERLMREAAMMAGNGQDAGQQISEDGTVKAGWVKQLITYLIMFIIFRFVGRKRDAWKLEYGVEEEIERLDAQASSSCS